MPTKNSSIQSLAGDTEPHLVKREDIDYIWDDVKALIADASVASRNKWSVDDAYDRLGDGRAQLWLAWQSGKVIACVITEIVPHDKRTACHIVTCAGWNIRKWFEHTDAVEAWAKSQGCDHVRADSHPVIAKLLLSKGYQASHICMERDI